MGLFIADLTLYVPPVALFSIMVVAFNIKSYAENMDSFALLCLGFGPALVSLTYMVSSCFATANSAMKCLVPLYLIIGTFLPFVVVILLYKFGEEGQGLMFWLIYDTLMVTDPFALFFFGNYSMIGATLPPRYEYGKILPGLYLTPTVCFVIFTFQTLVLLAISICIDSRRTNNFRTADKRQPVKRQPLLEARPDVLKSEEYVRKSA